MMNILPFSGVAMAAGMFFAAPAFAQTVSAKAMTTTQPTPKGHVAGKGRNSDWVKFRLRREEAADTKL